MDNETRNTTSSRSGRVAPSMRTGSTGASRRNQPAPSMRTGQTKRASGAGAARAYSETRTGSSQAGRSASASGSRVSYARTSSASSRQESRTSSTGTRSTRISGTRSAHSQSSSAAARTTSNAYSGTARRTSSSGSASSAQSRVRQVQPESTRTRTSSASRTSAAGQASVRSAGTQTSSGARRTSSQTGSRNIQKKPSSGSFLNSVKDKFGDIKNSVASGNKSKTKSSNGSSKNGLFGLSRFASFLIIYSAAFLVLIIIVAIILSSYLRSYESKQPSHVIESIVKEFSSTESLKAFIDKNRNVLQGTDSVLDFEDTYYSLVEGRDISFVSDSSKTTSEISAYKITADGAAVAGVELAKKKDDSWDISAVDISAAYTSMEGYSILVPEGATVFVNGTELGESSITGTGVPAILEYSSQFIKSKPEFVTYSVKLPAGRVPSVSGTDSNGKDLIFTQSDTTFVAGDGASQAFIDEVKDRVENGVDEYALYFEFLAFDLEDYIHPDCQRYKFIFGSEEFDRINPALYMYEYIDTNEFKEKSITNYTVYSDDCFTVDVKYDLLITFVTEGPYGHQELPDDELTMDATWVWVRYQDKWVISDIIDH